MDDDVRTERWKELCAQAAKEQDPEKLLKLVQEINRLLEQPHSPDERLNTRTPPELKPERRTGTTGPSFTVPS
jgi:hypothetical protein